MKSKIVSDESSPFTERKEKKARDDWMEAEATRLTFEQLWNTVQA